MRRQYKNGKKINEVSYSKKTSSFTFNKYEKRYKYKTVVSEEVNLDKNIKFTKNSICKVKYVARYTFNEQWYIELISTEVFDVINKKT